MAALATAYAKLVLPVPGDPAMRIAWGILSPDMAIVRLRVICSPPLNPSNLTLPQLDVLSLI